jgi:hypothetical protein
MRGRGVGSWAGAYVERVRARWGMGELSQLPSHVDKFGFAQAFDPEERAVARERATRDDACPAT